MSPWLFSRRTDLLAFGAPALASLALVALGLVTGAASGDTPPGLWLVAIVGVDVAHVWSTGYRVYADPTELRRRLPELIAEGMALDFSAIAARRPAALNLVPYDWPRVRQLLDGR